MSARRFGIADIVRVETLATKTCERWKSTSGEHRDVATQMQSLIFIFERLQSVFELDPSLSAQASDNEDLADLLESAEATIAGLYIFPDRLSAAANKPQKKQLFRHRQDEQEHLRDELKIIREDVDDFAKAFGILLQRITEGSGESQSDQASVAKSRGVRMSTDSKGPRMSVDSKQSRSSVDSKGNTRYASFGSSISPTSLQAHPGSAVPVLKQPAHGPVGSGGRSPDSFDLHLQGHRSSHTPRSSNKLKMFYGVPASSGSEPAAIAQPDWASSNSPDSDTGMSRRPSSNPDERIEGSRLAARRKDSTFLSFSSSGSSEPTSAVDTMRKLEGTLPVHRTRTEPMHESQHIAELDGSELRLTHSSSRPRLNRSGIFTPKTSPRASPPVSSDLVDVVGPGPSPTDSSTPSSKRDSTSTAERSASGPSSCTDPSPTSPRHSQLEQRGSKDEKVGNKVGDDDEENEDHDDDDDDEDEDEDEEEEERNEDEDDDADLQTPTTARRDIESAAPQITPFHFPSPLSPISMELN